MSRLQESISPTFYARLFSTKVWREAFLSLHFRFDLFLAKEYWRKCARKMLVKLTKLGADGDQTKIISPFYCVAIMSTSLSNLMSNVRRMLMSKNRLILYNERSDSLGVSWSAILRYFFTIFRSDCLIRLMFWPEVWRLHICFEFF
jgi:hypothetical protein